MYCMYLHIESTCTPTNYKVEINFTCKHQHLAKFSRRTLSEFLELPLWLTPGDLCVCFTVYICRRLNACLWKTMCIRVLSFFIINLLWYRYSGLALLGLPSFVRLTSTDCCRYMIACSDARRGLLWLNAGIMLIF